MATLNLKRLVKHPWTLNLPKFLLARLVSRRAQMPHLCPGKRGLERAMA
jgi:hypothetical protein